MKKQKENQGAAERIRPFSWDSDIVVVDLLLLLLPLLPLLLII